MNLPGSVQVEKHEFHNVIALKPPLGYTLIMQNHVFRQSRWVVRNQSCLE